jgi:hypothetical protein
MLPFYNWRGGSELPKSVGNVPPQTNAISVATDQAGYNHSMPISAFCLLSRRKHAPHLESLKTAND